MVPVLCSHPLKTRSINKYIWDPLWPPCAEEAGGPQSKDKTAGHEPGAREGRADRTRGPDWPQGGQARFPLGSQGLSSGKPDLPLTRNSKAGSRGGSVAKFRNKTP